MNSNFMEKISKIIQNHRIAFFVILLTALFFLFLMLILPSGNLKTRLTKSNPPDSTSRSISNQTSYTNTDNKPSVLTPWIIGQNRNYIISFPEDWIPTTRAVEGGGTSVTIQPKNLTGQDLLPKIYIKAVPNTNTSVSDTVSALSPLRLTQKSTVFKNIQAVTLSGTLPFTPLKDNPNQSFIHKTYIIFENNGTMYTIDYAAYEDSNQQRNDELMQSIINTIQFN